MNGWQTRFLHITTAAVAVTGLAYFVLKYAVGTDDPFAVVNHPLQPWMLKLHILVAPCLVFMFGIFWEWHVAAKIKNGQRANRLSGLLSTASFLVMTASGYLIQVSESEATRWWSVNVHIVSGILFTALYLVHQWISIRIRRRAAVSEASYVWVGLLAAALAFSLFLILGSSARAETTAGQKLPIERHVRRVYVMGTVCDLEIFGRERERSLEALETMVDILEATEAQLSTWREDSLLSRLNRTPALESTSLPPDVCRLFEQVRRLSAETDGAFDPGIGPLIDAWDIRGRGRVPTRKGIDRARSVSGLHHFQFEGCDAKRLNSAVWVDSGGFGKGEALDRIRASMAEARLTDPWMLNLGGQVAVSGKPPSPTEAWTVTLGDPAHRKGLLEVRMSAGSLATSGVSENDRQEATQGLRISHVLDPRSGNPVAHEGSVSVWHESGLVADALSTALFVMGPAEGRPWAERNGIAACFLTPSGSAAPGVAVETSTAFRLLMVD